MKALALAFALILTSLAALAQIGLPFPGPGTVHSGGGYVGPGDLVSSNVVAWYGLRGFSAAYSNGSNPAVQIERASDTDLCDLVVKTDGTLGNTAGGGCAHTGQSASTFCNATTCTIIRYYDQSQNAAGLNVVNHGSAANRCTLSPSPLEVVCNASAGFNNTDNSAGAINQPGTVSYVAKQTTSTAGSEVVDVGGTAWQVGFRGTNLVYGYAGTCCPTAAATDNAYHAVQTVINGASSVLYVDGSSNSVSLGASNAGASAIAVASQTNPLLGTWREAGIWSIGFNGTQQSNVNSNQRTFWGF